MRRNILHGLSQVPNSIQLMITYNRFKEQTDLVLLLLLLFVMKMFTFTEHNMLGPDLVIQPEAHTPLNIYYYLEAKEKLHQLLLPVFFLSHINRQRKYIEPG